jgi:hypothetical protein
MKTLAVAAAAHMQKPLCSVLTCLTHTDFTKSQRLWVLTASSVDNSHHHVSDAPGALPSKVGARQRDGVLLVEARVVGRSLLQPPQGASL